MVAGLEKGLPIQTTSRLVTTLDFFQRPLEPPSTRTTDHSDLVPLTNGHTDSSSTGIDQDLPSGIPVRLPGSPVTAASSTSSARAPQRNFDDIIKFLEKELESRPRSVWSHQLLEIWAYTLPVPRQPLDSVLHQAKRRAGAYFSRCPPGAT